MIDSDKSSAGEEFEGRENPEPLSGDDWAKELADIKGEVPPGPEIPENPVRLSTPPPGGFKIPSIHKETARASVPPIEDEKPPILPDTEEELDDEPYEEEEEDFEDDFDEDDFEDEDIEDEDAQEENPESETEEEDGFDDLSDVENLNIPQPSDSAAKVSRIDIESALGGSSGEIDLPRKPSGPAKEKAGTAGVMLSVLLFFALALSVLAGYHFRSKEGVEYYIKRLGSEDPAIQSHARDSLSFFGNAAVPRLMDVVGSGDERNALAAVDTLAVIESEDSVRNLMSLTTHCNAQIRRRALAALGERAAPQAFSNIEDQIGSEDHDTRLCAIAALENFDPQKSVPILLDLLDDEDWRIRNEAGKALQVITGQGLGAPKSTYSEKMNDIIRQRWREWWEKEGAGFVKPENNGD